MQSDLSIPDFLLVKNRKDTDAVSEDVKTTAYVEPWEMALRKLEPEDFRRFLLDRMRRGRFEKRWLVVDLARSQSDVDWTVVHWRAKFEAGLAAVAARSAEAKAKVRSTKAGVTVPDRIDPAARIAFGGANPKKEGTSAYKRWALLMSHDGKTVGEFLKAKGNPTTLANAIKSGHVTLEEGKTDGGRTENGASGDAGNGASKAKAKGKKARGSKGKRT